MSVENAIAKVLDRLEREKDYTISLLFLIMIVVLLFRPNGLFGATR